MDNAGKKEQAKQKILMLFVIASTLVVAAFCFGYGYSLAI